MTKTHPAVSIHKRWINPLLGLALAALAIALGGCGDSDVDSSKTRSLAKGIFGGPGHTYTQDFLISSDVQAGDRFGWFVRVAGNTMVVGAPQEDGGAGDPIFDVGAVYVLKKDGAGTWNEAQILRPSDGQISDSFGYVLDFDGQTIAIQSWFEDGGPGDPALDTGAVYLFEPDGSGNWIEKTILHASDMQPGDIFGAHLSVRGNTILVGSALEDGGSGDPLADSGAIYVFQRDGGGVWNETQILRSSEIQGGDFFSGVALYGNTAVIGARGEDGGPGDPILNAGAAYVFQRSGGSFLETQILRASDRQPGDALGGSVDVSAIGDVMIVGAEFEDGGPGDPFPDSGAAYIFEKNASGLWVETQILRPSTPQAGARFGHFTGMQRNVAFVCAWYEDADPGTLNNTGAYYIFSKYAGKWVETAKVENPDPTTNDWACRDGDFDGETAYIATEGLDGGVGDPLLDAGGFYLVR